MSTPTNIDDIINSRDIISRLEELRDERQDLTDAVEDAQTTIDDLDDEATDEDRQNSKDELDAAQANLDEWDTENKAELDALEAVNSEGEDYAADWTHGETMIREDYFEVYAQQLAEDIGAIPADLKWPFTHIDWESAAEELKQDYSTINFDGTDYYVRS